MVSKGAELEPGMEVYTADDTNLGAIKRVWRSDGSVQPREPIPVSGTMSVNPGSQGSADGYFLIARPLAPDWYVPFSAIRDITPGRAVLNVTAEEARRLPWQIAPS